MKITVSDLAYGGFRHNLLSALPTDVGIEIFHEFGTDVFWDACIPRMLSGRQGNLSFHGPCVATNLAEETDVDWYDAFSHTLDEAAAYGAEFVVVHTNERFEGDRSSLQELVKERLESIVLYGQEKGITVAIENVGLCVYDNVLFDQDEYIELMMGIPQAKSLIDVGHAHVNGWDLEAVISQLGEKIIAYHLHDNDTQGDAHLFIGEGTVDWDNLFPVIREYTPDANLVLEYTSSMPIETLSDHIRQLKAKYQL